MPFLYQESMEGRLAYCLLHIWNAFSTIFHSLEWKRSKNDNFEFPYMLVILVSWIYKNWVVHLSGYLIAKLRQTGVHKEVLGSVWNRRSPRDKTITFQEISWFWLSTIIGAKFNLINTWGGDMLEMSEIIWEIFSDFSK